MKSESIIKPAVLYEITLINEQAEVVLMENITEVPPQDGQSTIFAWDEYRIIVRSRDTLVDDIEKNFAIWLKAAKDLEYNSVATDVRKKRNELLSATDSYFCFDRLELDIPSDLTVSNMLSSVKKFFVALSSNLSGDMAKYRQELRDLTKQNGFPYEVDFPTMPE